MKGFARIIFVLALLSPLHVYAQSQDPRVTRLRDRILERIPDVPSARRGLGRGSARSSYATRHAAAIVRASDMYESEWVSFVERGNWQSFTPHTDLPNLIAAIAYKESAFQPVVRLDNNTRVFSVRDMSPNRRARRRARGDMGFMQVRVPGAVARQCGAVRADMQRLLEDYNFNYQIGTCILTKSLAAYVERYTQRSYRRMGHNQRPRHVRSFFVRDNPDLQDLVVIERYNWGGRDLYDHRVASGYARRVLREYLFFRGDNERG